VQTRRDFLQLLAASAAALALDPLQGVLAFGREYANSRLGLSVRLPDGWEFSSVADFVALRERQVLQDALDHVPGEPHPLKDPENLPVFLFEHPAHREGHFAPAIALFDEDLEEPKPSDEPAAHARFLRILSRTYRDLKVLDEPQPVSLQGTIATLSRCSYLHEINTGESHPLEVRTMVVFRPPRVHTFYLIDSATSTRIPERVWQKFLESVRYISPGLTSG
jgi:hypothetical protein